MTAWMLSLLVTTSFQSNAEIQRRFNEMLRNTNTPLGSTVGHPGYGATAQLTTIPLQVGETELSVNMLGGYPHVQDEPVTLGLVIENTREGDERQIEIEFAGACNGKRRLRLAAHEERRLFFYLPALPESRWVSIKIGKQETGAQIPVTDTTGQAFTFAHLGNTGVLPNGEWFVFANISRHLPDSWRGLSGFSTIAVSQSELAANKAWHPLLRDWVAMGGTLILSSKPSQTEHVLEELPLHRIDNGGSTTKGFILDATHAGLGTIIWVNAKQSRLLSREDVEPHLSFVRLEPHQRLSTMMASFLSEGLTNVGEPPVKGLLILLCCFALIIGPAGWIFWVHYRRRPFAYLLWAIGGSSLFCAAIVTVNLISEGRIPIGTARSVRLVDQRADLQLDFEEAAVFAPMRSTSELRTPSDATLLVSGGETPSDCTFGTKTSHQWVRDGVPVRSGRVIGMKRVSHPEGRLVVVPTDDGIQVENHLDADLDLLYVWHKSHLYQIDALDRGERARGEITSQSSVMNDIPDGAITVAASVTLESVVNGERGHHRFVAKLRRDEHSPMLASGLREVGDAVHLIGGIY